MCGIIGFTGKSEAAGILLDGLEKLEYRGYDSAGIAVLGNNKFSIEKTTERISTLKNSTDDGKNINGNLGIGHTRWATHGGPSIPNAHPHKSGDGKFCVVHNGIIENYVALRQELTDKGYTFVSETDTEVVPHLLEMYYKGNLLEAVKKTVARLEGSYALGIICSDCPDTLVAVREFSPLILGICKDSKFIASDITALVKHTKDVVYLDDGEIAVLTPETAKVYDIDGNEKPLNISKIDWDVSTAEKNGYDHFMMKEIHEQPTSVRNALKGRLENGKVTLNDLKLNADRLKDFNKITIVACGSAYHAGVVGKYVFEELLRIPTDVDLASEYRYRNPIADKHTLTIFISQSGETADTLAALREAKERGSYILSVVNVIGSSIAKESDDVLYTYAGPEIAVATTKGYTTQLILLYLFALYAANALGSAESNEIAKITAEIAKLPDKIESIISNEKNIAEIAKHCGDPKSLFFIGRNIDYAVALEASLKLKEISYIHSEAYAAGELKHGTISLIEEGRTVISFNCYNPLSDKLLSNVKEVKARGAYVISCAMSKNEGLEAESDDVIYIPKTHNLLVGSLEIIPFQIYSYYVALYKGCDIDKPRNLAKSVTVE